MNVCRYISSIWSCTNAFVRSKCSTSTTRAQVIQRAWRSYLPGLVRHRIWQNSQIVSLTLRRELHIKKGNKNLFSGRHRLDKVPAQYSVVYNSTLGPWFIMFRVGMGTMSIVMAVAYYHIIQDFSKDFFETNKGIFICVSTLLFLIILSAFSISARRFFTRIYYHSDSGDFIGVKRNLFGRLKQLEYTIEDVKPYGTKVMNNLDRSESTLVNIKGQKVQLHGRYFISPVFYNMHIGESFMDSQIREPRF